MPTNHGEISQTQHVSLNLAHSLSSQCPVNYSISSNIQRKEHKAKQITLTAIIAWSRSGNRLRWHTNLLPHQIQLVLTLYQHLLHGICSILWDPYRKQNKLVVFVYCNKWNWTTPTPLVTASRSRSGRRTKIRLVKSNWRKSQTIGGGKRVRPWDAAAGISRRGFKL